jgi:hypothetical protein
MFDAGGTKVLSSFFDLNFSCKILNLHRFSYCTCRKRLLNSGLDKSWKL